MLKSLFGFQSNKEGGKKDKNKKKSSSLSYSSDSSSDSFGGSTGVGGGKLAERLIVGADGEDNAYLEKPPCAVILTVVGGSSYDEIFTTVPQVSPEPDKVVAVFRFNYSFIPDILKKLRGEPCTTNAVIDNMCEMISQVEPDSFVTNFECCSGCCAHKGFPAGCSAAVMDLVAWLVAHKHIAMFGDFSLKSLIKDWNESLLGPNPFVNLGETCSSLQLKFDPNVLKECANAQLQHVGSMCDSGTAVVSVMPDTIVFSLNKANVELAKTSGAFEAQVLTVARATQCPSMFEIKGELTEGTVGHASVKYPTGGELVVSAGHWIELTNLDNVDEEVVLRSFEAQMGTIESSGFRDELSSAGACNKMRSEVVQRRAKQLVLSSAPCKYSKSKSSM